MTSANGKLTRRELVGRCGLFCGSCAIYAVSHEPALAERRGRTARHFGCAEKAVACEGCQGLTPSCWGNGCEILRCLNEHAVTYCDECPGFSSCSRYADLDAKYGGALRTNLGRRREVGDEGWLREQLTERACSRCGRALIYGEGDCAYCSVGGNE